MKNRLRNKSTVDQKRKFTSINQSIDHTISQSINRRFKPCNQSVNQSIDGVFIQSLDEDASETLLVKNSWFSCVLYRCLSVTRTAHDPVGSLSSIRSCTFTPASRAFVWRILPNSSFPMQPVLVTTLDLGKCHWAMRNELRHDPPAEYSTCWYFSIISCDLNSVKKEIIKLLPNDKIRNAQQQKTNTSKKSLDKKKQFQKKNENKQTEINQLINWSIEYECLLREINQSIDRRPTMSFDFLHLE